MATLDDVDWSDDDSMYEYNDAGYPLGCSCACECCGCNLICEESQYMYDDEEEDD